MPSPYQSVPPRYYPPIYAPAYYPPPAPVLSRDERRKRARHHRANAIALLAVGLSLNAAGVILMAYGGAVPQNPNGTNSLANGINATEIVAGITGTIVGVTLWAPGAAAYVEWDRNLRAIARERDPVPATPAPAPLRHTMIFGSPVIRF